MVHVFGDSHAHFCFKNIPSIEIHSVLWPEVGMTMHKIGRDGLRALDISSCNSNIFLFLYGEIDCRFRIHQQLCSRTLEDVINDLTNRYFETLLLNYRSGLSFYVVSVIPPSYFFVPNDVKNVIYKDGFVFFQSNKATQMSGTNEERSYYTSQLNNALKEKSKQYGYGYLDIYELYKDANGMLPVILTDDMCHINNTSHVQNLLKSLEII